MIHAQMKQGRPSEAGGYEALVFFFFLAGVLMKAYLPLPDLVQADPTDGILLCVITVTAAYLLVSSLRAAYILPLLCFCLGVATEEMACLVVSAFAAQEAYAMHRLAFMAISVSAFFVLAQNGLRSAFRMRAIPGVREILAPTGIFVLATVLLPVYLCAAYYLIKL
ncbi:MAG: hypothetical protein IJ594_03965 [Oscillospiraceae bacterium]|nr:hypothetical protein [Oscillospiraceae bacterium]